MGRRKAERKRGLTVDEVRRELQAAHQRGQLIRELIDLLDLRYGRRADGDPDFVRTLSGGYEQPNKNVVEQLRSDLLAAWRESFEKHKHLAAAEVVGVDKSTLDWDWPVGRRRQE